MSMTDEVHRFARFIAAQDPVYEDAVTMLRNGRMCTPYMDFIFPRLAAADERMADRRFAIESLDEARAYLVYPKLGNRYRECVEALMVNATGTATAVFGSLDAAKLQASLTLFSEASNEPLLRIMLSVWFDELVDEETMMQLQTLA
jgi:uncharacterized protein (DUF1810 family)